MEQNSGQGKASRSVVRPFTVSMRAVTVTGAIVEGAKEVRATSMAIAIRKAAGWFVRDPMLKWKHLAELSIAATRDAGDKESKR